MKKPLIVAVVCGLLVIGAAIAMGKRDSYRSPARRAWKEKAIAEISARVVDPAWLTQEKALTRRQATNEESSATDWFSERLVVMKNGDWLAYANICKKEDSRIHDLFLARGSDGQWYYSTYHFCIKLIALRVDEQPDDLAGFIKTYCLRPFDGRSDDCLQKTWPPNSK